VAFNPLSPFSDMIMEVFKIAGYRRAYLAFVNNLIAINLHRLWITINKENHITLLKPAKVQVGPFLSISKLRPLFFPFLQTEKTMTLDHGIHIGKVDITGEAIGKHIEFETPFDIEAFSFLAVPSHDILFTY
jgi:hypothetical protein